MMTAVCDIAGEEKNALILADKISASFSAAIMS